MEVKFNKEGDAAFYTHSSGVHVPFETVVDTDQGYDLTRLERSRNRATHFWNLGRARFVLRAVRDQISDRTASDLKVIDIGGGTGGWLKYLMRNLPGDFTELALADSSLSALEFSSGVLGAQVNRYQVDVLRMPWKNRWDLVFLLDVIEHVKDDVQALRGVEEALRPNGLLFVTVPALQCFWSGEDVTAHHLRRYAKPEFDTLAQQSGLELLKARYFMFFLSPLYWLGRGTWPDPATMTPEQIRKQKARTHQVPPTPINQLLRLIFSLETPLGLRVPFPWGTSLLGVFKKCT